MGNTLALDSVVLHQYTSYSVRSIRVVCQYDLLEADIGFYVIRVYFVFLVGHL